MFDKYKIAANDLAKKVCIGQFLICIDESKFSLK